MTHVFLLTHGYRTRAFASLEGAKARALTWYNEGPRDYAIEWSQDQFGDSWQVLWGAQIEFEITRLEVMP